MRRGRCQMTLSDNNASLWLFLESWNLPDSTLCWESKMELSVEKMVLDIQREILCALMFQAIYIIMFGESIDPYFPDRISYSFLITIWSGTPNGYHTAPLSHIQYLNKYLFKYYISNFWVWANLHDTDLLHYFRYIILWNCILQIWYYVENTLTKTYLE